MWIINHKHSKNVSSLFIQSHAKTDLYETSRTIKVDVDGLREISSVNTVCWDVTESLQVARGISSKIIESYKFHKKLAGTSWNLARRREKKSKACNLSQSSQKRDAKSCSTGIAE